MKPEDVQELIAEFAPELRGLYVVFGSRTFRELAAAGEYEGATALNMDLRLRDYISPWQGRRPAILLNDRPLAEEAAAGVETWGGLAAAERWTFGRVALHEAAHVLDKGPPYFGGSDGGGEPFPENLKLAMAEFLTLPEEVVRPRVEFPPWFMHGPQWLRAVIHLAFRATRAGLYLTPAAVVGFGDYYGLSHPCRYSWELSDEPQRCLGRPFHEILSEPAPEGFTALWRSDTEEPINRE